MRRSVVACVVALVALAAAAGPAGAAASGPDLDAFSGCVSAHSAVAAYGRGETPRPALVNLVAATVAASRTQGARKVTKALRRAKTAERTQAAMTAVAAWCTAHGVPAIAVPTTPATPTTPAG